MPRKVTAALMPLAAGMLLSQGAFAEEDVSAPPALPLTENAEETSTPEPNTTLLAGLGGLALLFFALRRKQ